MSLEGDATKPATTMTIRAACEAGDDEADADVDGVGGGGGGAGVDGDAGVLLVGVDGPGDGPQVAVQTPGEGTTCWGLKDRIAANWFYSWNQHIRHIIQTKGPKCKA